MTGSTGAANSPPTIEQILRRAIECQYLCDTAPLLAYSDWLKEQEREDEAAAVAELVVLRPAERWLRWTGRSTKQLHGLWVWDDESDCCLNWNYHYHGGSFSPSQVAGYLPAIFRFELRRCPNNVIHYDAITHCTGGWYYGAYYVAPTEWEALHSLSLVYHRLVARHAPIPMQKWPAAYLERLYAPNPK